MANTKAGGRKTGETNKAKYGPDFYRKIGAMGGKKTHESGKLAEVNFAANRERARIAGAKGGAVSKRKPKGE